MFKFAFAALALAAAPAANAATQLVLAPSSVIGSSGYYTACCSFQPGNVLDQQAGTVTESFGGGYWLNPDNGPAAAYITIDLGTAYSLSSIDLFNTHNGTYGDRGTGSFAIYGSNSVTGGQLDTPTLLTSGALAAADPSAALSGQSFGLSGYYRYISFNPTGVATFNTACCGTNVYGLNEVRVFAVVPEPATWGLMIAGFGLTGFAMRRRAALAA